jgi:hypothetical protein
MLVAKKCEFCGRAFVVTDGRNGNSCIHCSGTRRKLAGQHFLANSGPSEIFGNYLLSEKQVHRLGAFKSI